MPKTLSASDLYYSVGFESRETASDGYGGTTDVWTEVFECRAAYHHLRGGEGVMAGRLEGKHTQIITVRASSQAKQVNTDWRIVDKRNGDVFNIRDIEPQIDRQWIGFLAEKGVA